MSVAALRRGWLRFYSLRIDGEFVAHQFCLERDGVMSLLQEGFDVRLADRGIGNALRVLVFREAMERGVAVYDFLAGVSSHKLSWGAVQKNSVCITASPPGPKGRAYFALRQARAWGRRQGKRTLTRLGLYRDRT
jgi:CelD/BcsL family acetyltransferase involved in cellulose biosynthesis